MSRCLRATGQAAVLLALVAAGACQGVFDPGNRGRRPLDPDLVAEGRQIFRFDTFGDEAYWTDTLRLNEAVQQVDPVTALAVGLKVDAELVPAEVLATADLTDPATTAALLKLGAVVGVKADVDDTGTISRLGITCALCHSTVDNSVLPGVGSRLDGWPNRDLNVGAIVALSPVLDDGTKAVLRSWGPGRYDAYLSHDGESSTVQLPPAYGLRDVALETYTGEGPVWYWNAYVAVTQMHGSGSFSDPRLGIEIVREPDRADRHHRRRQQLMGRRRRRGGAITVNHGANGAFLTLDNVTLDGPEYSIAFSPGNAIVDGCTGLLWIPVGETRGRSLRVGDAAAGVSGPHPSGCACESGPAAGRSIWLYMGGGTKRFHSWRSRSWMSGTSMEPTAPRTRTAGMPTTSRVMRSMDSSRLRA